MAGTSSARGKTQKSTHGRTAKTKAKAKPKKKRAVDPMAAKKRALLKFYENDNPQGFFDFLESNPELVSERITVNDHGSRGSVVSDGVNLTDALMMDVFPLALLFDYQDSLFLSSYVRHHFGHDTNRDDDFDFLKAVQTIVSMMDKELFLQKDGNGLTLVGRAFRGDRMDRMKDCQDIVKYIVLKNEEALLVPRIAGQGRIFSLERLPIHDLLEEWEYSDTKMCLLKFLGELRIELFCPSTTEDWNFHPLNYGFGALQCDPRVQEYLCELTVERGIPNDPQDSRVFCICGYAEHEDDPYDNWQAEIYGKLLPHITSFRWEPQDWSEEGYCYLLKCLERNTTITTATICPQILLGEYGDFEEILLSDKILMGQLLNVIRNNVKLESFTIQSESLTSGFSAGQLVDAISSNNGTLKRLEFQGRFSKDNDEGNGDEEKDATLDVLLDCHKPTYNAQNDDVYTIDCLVLRNWLDAKQEEPSMTLTILVQMLTSISSSEILDESRKHALLFASLCRSPSLWAAGAAATVSVNSQPNGLRRSKRLRRH